MDGSITVLRAAIPAAEMWFNRPAPRHADLESLRSFPGSGTRPKLFVLLGLLWALLLVFVLSSDTRTMVMVVTPVNLLAVPTAMRRVDEHSLDAGLPLGGAAVAALSPIAALWGAIPFLVVMAAGLIMAVGNLGQAPGPTPRKAHAPLNVRLLLAAMAPAVAAGCMVLAARQGSSLLTALVISWMLFDVANAVMGTGETGGVAGAISGAVTVLIWGVIVEALFVPPFTEVSCWIGMILVAVLAPTSVWWCEKIIPGRVPAVRRLDSMVLAGPAWVIFCAMWVPHT